MTGSFNAVEKHEAEAILSAPDTSYALEISALFSKRQLNRANIEKMLLNLPKDAEGEKHKLKTLLDDSYSDIKPDISTRTGQLIWAMGLAYTRAQAPKKMLYDTPIWKNLAADPQMQASLGLAARFIDSAVKNPSATISWGAPGSWFNYTLEKNHVNIDMFTSLLAGFAPSPAKGLRPIANATAVMLHEVGHAQLTVGYPQRLDKVMREYNAMVAESRERKLDEAERKRMMKLKREFNLRQKSFNAIEDACVNRFAVNQSASTPYDFKNPLNHCALVIQRLAEKDVAPKKDAKDKVTEAKLALANLNKAIVLAFYGDNGLFDLNDKRAWKRFGVDTDAIKGIAPDGKEYGFDHMLDMIVGINGSANLLPQNRDAWLLKSMYDRSVNSFARQRQELAEELWDVFADRYAQEIINAPPKPKKDNKNKKGLDDDNSSGSSDDNDDAASNDDGAKDKNQPKSNDDSDDGNAPDDGDFDEDDIDDDIDDGEFLPEDPKDEKKRKLKEVDDTPPENKKNLKELAQESKKQEQKADDNKNKDEKPNRDKLNIGTDTGSGSSSAHGLDLSELAKGNWRDYKKRINELEPLISRVTGEFKYVREQQKQPIISISKERDILPRSSDIVKSLDMRIHTQFAVKRATWQRIEQKDLNRWKREEMTTEPTSVELWLMCDGSGSMCMGSRPIDAAVQSMAILYEAGKRAQMDVFATMWGDNNIRMVAQPGDSESDIGENFQRIKDGIRSGTELSPSFSQAIARTGDYVSLVEGRPKRYAGMTHFMILTDGELFGSDLGRLEKILGIMHRHGPDFTVDVAILGTHGGSSVNIDDLIDGVKVKSPGINADYFFEKNNEDIPLQLVRKIRRRLESGKKEIPAISDQVKRDMFKDVSRRIGR